MNRDIEFRGLDAQGYWNYGYYFQDGLDNHYIVYLKKQSDRNYYYGKTYTNIEVTPETIGQYTGLKDKNGKKIFEGDIIDIHQTVNGYNQFVIEYDKYKFSARYYNQDKKQTGSWYGYDLDELFEINESEKEIEVIGNIYENKELLEG